MYVTEVYIKHAIKICNALHVRKWSCITLSTMLCRFCFFSWFLYHFPVRTLVSMLVFGRVAFVFLFKENEV